MKYLTVLPYALWGLFKRLWKRTRVARMREIEKQIDFWHAEEERTMQEAFEAFRTGGVELFRPAWQRHLTASARRKAEVSDKIKELK